MCVDGFLEGVSNVLYMLLVIPLFICSFVDGCLRVFMCVYVMLSLLTFRFVSVLVLRFLSSFSFFFVLRVFFSLLKTLLLPHTRVCGLCR